MGGVWPFKRKAAEPEEQDVVVYERGNEGSEEVLQDRSHIEEDAYQKALDLLASPHLGESEAGQPVTTTLVGSDGVEQEMIEKALAVSLAPGGSDGDTKQEESSDADDPADGWIHHTDGYWYRRSDDGGFEATPHLRGDDGSFTPYS